MNGKYQVGSGRVVASAHDMPFIANTIVPKNSDLSTEHKKKIKAFPAVTKINGLKKTEKPICMTLFRLQIKI